MGIKEEFIVSKGKKYPWQLGKFIAASLPGFLGGFIAALIILSPLIVWLLIEIYSLKNTLSFCFKNQF